MSPREKFLHRSGRSLFNPGRWGLSVEVVGEMPRRFDSFFAGFAGCFATKTWNNWGYAKVYLEGLLCMQAERNYAAIGRTMNGPRDDGQNIQHFMSDSGWDAHKVFAGIRRQITANPALAGGALVIDGSSDGKKGSGAGVSRQYSGRLGKVDSCQVWVSLAYCTGIGSALVDADLYLPEEWFNDEHRKAWPSLRIPAEREFKTKLEIAGEMVMRAKDGGLGFSVVLCDDEYGSSHYFRRFLNRNGITYVADASSKTLFYREKPRLEVPENPPGRRGRRYVYPRPVSARKPLHLSDIATEDSLEYYRIKVRDTDRGDLVYEMAFLRGWTVSRDGEILEETLLIRRDADGTCSYSLSNAPADTPYDILAKWRSHRYYVERVFQDAKSELGWDELVAGKYRAWMHHAALVALGLWFIVLMLMLFRQGQQGQALSLSRQLKVNAPPPVSVANVKLMFQTAFYFTTFNEEECLHVILKILINRANSARARLKHGNKTMKKRDGES